MAKIRIRCLHSSKPDVVIPYRNIIHACYIFWRIVRADTKTYSRVEVTVKLDKTELIYGWGRGYNQQPLYRVDVVE